MRGKVIFQDNRLHVAGLVVGAEPSVLIYPVAQFVVQIDEAIKTKTK